MADAKEPDDYFNVQPRKDVGARLYAIVTRRDRAPGPMDESCEAVALHLEELSAAICSRTAASFNVTTDECQTGAFLGILIESLGIVRERSPVSYETLIGSIIALDPTIAPLRNAVIDLGRPDDEQLAVSLRTALTPVWHKLERDRSRVLAIAVTVGGFLGILSTLIGLRLAEPSSQTMLPRYHIQQSAPVAHETFTPKIYAPLTPG